MDAYFASMPDGRTSVKSQYHCATLVGNWEEERRSFGPQMQQQQNSDGSSTFLATTLVPPPTSGGPVLCSESDTTYTTSYVAHGPAGASGTDAYLATGVAAEAPRELLFYHGDLAKPTEKSLLTIQEMSYTNHKTSNPYTNDEVLDLPGVSTRMDKTATLRKSMGLAASSSCSRTGGRGGSSGAEDDEVHNSAAIEKESATIRALVQPAVDAASTQAASADQSANVGSGAGGYAAPRLPPVGRVAARDALLTTKNVSIDATGVHLYSNLEAYPLTSSVCVGEMVASKNNPMHRTHLRVEYELTK